MGPLPNRELLRLGIGKAAIMNLGFGCLVVFPGVLVVFVFFGWGCVFFFFFFFCFFCFFFVFLF